MNKTAVKAVKSALLLLFLAAIYFVAVKKHEQRAEIRQSPVTLTAGCVEKLGRYALSSGAQYRSPYVMQRTSTASARRGYSDDDVRAIQRGCNVVDDTQGRQALDGPAYRRRHCNRAVWRERHRHCSHVERMLCSCAASHRVSGTVHRSKERNARAFLHSRQSA